MGQVPSLAPVKERRLHHCLVKLGSDLWCHILPSQHLRGACPYPPRLADLLSHGLDIVVVLGEEASKVLENLDSLEYIPMYREGTIESKH